MPETNVPSQDRREMEHKIVEYATLTGSISQPMYMKWLRSSSLSMQTQPVKHDEDNCWKTVRRQNQSRNEQVSRDSGGAFFKLWCIKYRRFLTHLSSSELEEADQNNDTIIIAIYYVTTYPLTVKLIVAAQRLGLVIGASLMDIKKATTLASATVMTFMLAGGFLVKVQVVVAKLEYLAAELVDLLAMPRQYL